MTIYQTARFKVRSEALEQCEQAIRKFVAYVRGYEPGTLLYSSVQEREDPASFLHFILCQDGAARTIHRSVASCRSFVRLAVASNTAGHGSLSTAVGGNETGSGSELAPCPHALPVHYDRWLAHGLLSEGDSVVR